VWVELLLFEIRYLVWLERLLLEIRYFVWLERLLLEILYFVWMKLLLLIAAAYWSTVVVSAANAADRNPFVSVRFRFLYFANPTTYIRRIRGQYR